MKGQSLTLQHLFLVVVVIVLSSSSAFSQDIEKGTVEVTGLVGLVSGIGTHSVIGGSAGMAIRDRILVNADLTYIPLGSNSIDVLGVRSEFSAKAVSFNVGGQYLLKPTKKMSPYVGAGVGFIHSSSSSSVTTSFEGFDFSSGSSGTNAYFNIGGGARYYVNKRWGFKPELMIFAGSKTFARLSGGIFFQFGK